MKAATTLVNIMDLTIGNIVHFHGARFEITSTRVADAFCGDNSGEPVMVAYGKWLDGETVDGYFGPNKNWTFQGNASVRHLVEAR